MFDINIAIELCLAMFGFACIGAVLGFFRSLEIQEEQKDKEECIKLIEKLIIRGDFMKKPTVCSICGQISCGHY